MATDSTPGAIAREVLRLLAVRRIAPTPDNFTRVYQEIAGAAAPPANDTEADALLSQARALPPALAGRSSIVRSGGQACGALIGPGTATAVSGLLRALAAMPGRSADGGPESADRARPWAALIDDLIKEWDIRRPGWTAARKRESLQRSLEVSARSADALLGRLRSLVASWKQPSGRPSVVIEIAEQAEALGQQASEVLSEMRAALAHTLDSIAPAHLADAPALAESARHLAVRVRGARDIDNMLALRNELREFLRQVMAHATTQSDLRVGLLRLLRLLVDNIHDIALGDAWLQQQIDIVRQALDRPLTPVVLGEAEKALRDLMLKQSLLKQSLDEARETLKALVKSLVDQLGSLSESTGDFCVRLDRYTERISTAREVSELNSVLAELIEDTRAIQTNTERTRHELNVARNRVGLAELRIQQMERELETLSERAREDTLTGALNRRGLDEVFRHESGRSDRGATPLCMALLDVDNFKQLNDRLGHQAGDAALTHLVSVIKGGLRDRDAVARYGGEEFVLLLPATATAEAAAVMTRLQRELTKRFFLHNNERLLITFSCGVAERRPGEAMEALLARADGALYKAKQAGKNRVFVAEAA